jgi:hypothetical protein
MLRFCRYVSDMCDVYLIFNRSSSKLAHAPWGCAHPDGQLEPST